MKKRTWPLFAWISILITGGGVFLFSKTVKVLTVSNSDHPCSLLFKIAPSERFAMFYTHSIYDVLVEETFEARSGSILLKSIKTDSPAVLEYYGFEGTGESQDMNLSLGPTFAVKVGVRQEQKLAVGEKTIDLHTIADPGDRVRISVDSVSLASYVLSAIFRQGKSAPRQ